MRAKLQSVRAYMNPSECGHVVEIEVTVGPDLRLGAGNTRTSKSIELAIASGFARLEMGTLVPGKLSDEELTRAIKALQDERLSREKAGVEKGWGWSNA